MPEPVALIERVRPLTDWLVCDEGYQLTVDQTIESVTIHSGFAGSNFDKKLCHSEVTKEIYKDVDLAIPFEKPIPIVRKKVA